MKQQISRKAFCKVKETKMKKIRQKRIHDKYYRIERDVGFVKKIAVVTLLPCTYTRVKSSAQPDYTIQYTSRLRPHTAVFENM
ncbi:hypothetical protein T06_10193 [Trichinella sp. T6]|nr:hypothetical protein T06_4040 [Trichinella sp. T6]KRX81462.1 hypothetical protein T06_10193 [Trichinella sp. T6]